MWLHCLCCSAHSQVIALFLSLSSTKLNPSLLRWSVSLHILSSLLIFMISLFPHQSNVSTAALKFLHPQKLTRNSIGQIPVWGFISWNVFIILISSHGLLPFFLFNQSQWSTDSLAYRCRGWLINERAVACSFPSEGLVQGGRWNNGVQLFAVFFLKPPSVNPPVSGNYFCCFHFP